MASQPLTVFVVENDAEFRVALVDFLEGKGFHVWQAASAAEAMDRLRAPGELPHLMLVELGLAEVGGPALIDTLGQSRARDVPVVALTGYDPADSEATLAVPAVAKWQSDRLLVLLAEAAEQVADPRRAGEEIVATNSSRNSRLLQ